MEKSEDDFPVECIDSEVITARFDEDILQLLK